MRVAVYYAPALDDPLWDAGAAWLGRDPERNTVLPGVAPGLTEEAARYGFHATLKPPMRLRPGVSWESVVTAAGAVAAGMPRFDLPRLEVADLEGFLALRETVPCPALQALSDAAVAGLDGLRAAPDAAELARRRKGGLSAAQEANLVRWGYPYVFGTWFFHMTLTRRLAAAERATVLPAAVAHFAAALAVPRRVTDLCLFTEAVPGAAFLLSARLNLSGGP